MSSTSMSTPAARPHRADAATRGVRLTLPVHAAGGTAEIELEPAHCERLFRAAAYVAIRDGDLRPGEEVFAQLVPGRTREQHGPVRCLDSCAVELLAAGGRLVTRVEFPRAVFAAFAAARAVHLLVAAGQAVETLSIAYSLHALDAVEEPFPVDIPALRHRSIAALTRNAVAHGTPADDWVVTFVAPDVLAGLDAIERLSRESGAEAAGRLHARVGFDRARRRFVRILERLVISRATSATGTTVVSTAASWGDFLAASNGRGPRAFSHLHTHLHLSDTAAGDGVPGDHLLSASPTLRAEGDPCVSIEDIVTHFTVFPDPLSAMLVVSLFPDRRVLKVYGYTPGAALREEPGYWVLPPT